jgi:NDP-sugar pyrophosphorylase family protein
MQCLILAGGLGTRISSIAGQLPKTLIPVNGRPFAFMQLDWLARNGVTDVIYCIGNKGQQIKDAIGDGSAFKIRVRYCDEGEDLLGTGGAIRLACSKGFMEHGFFVLYGDSWVPIDLEPVWKSSHDGKRVCMTVLHNRNEWDKSNIQFTDGRIIRYDKSVMFPLDEGIEHIDFGISVFTRDLIQARLPLGVAYNLSDLMSALVQEGQMLGHEVLERFYEIGTPQGLLDLEKHLETKRNFALN